MDYRAIIQRIDCELAAHREEPQQVSANYAEEKEKTEAEMASIRALLHPATARTRKYLTEFLRREADRIDQELKEEGGSM